MYFTDTILLTMLIGIIEWLVEYDQWKILRFSALNFVYKLMNS